jgi:sec-independent protein translocase protein TatA
MMPLGLFGTVGATEILVILLIVVLLFGARKIPELAKGLGEGIRNFRSSVKEPDPDEGKNDTGNRADDPGR